jgi:hypothetical protein
MATNNDSNSYPPTNPSGSFTRTIAPIMSIIRSMADILVTMPRIRNIPPITSNRPISRASSGGSPMLPKKPCVLAIFSNFGNPCAKKVIPAKILIGRGP